MSDMSSHYIVSAKFPTAVTCSAVGKYTDHDARNLITAKCNHIVISEFNEQGIQEMDEVHVNGTIAAMGLLTVKTSSQQRLVVLTDKHKFSATEFDPSRREHVTCGAGDLRPSVKKLIDGKALMFVEPAQRMLGFHVFSGFVNLVPVNEDGSFQEPEDVRIFDVAEAIDIQFLHAYEGSGGLMTECSKPTIIVLHEDRLHDRHASVFQVIPGETMQLEKVESFFLQNLDIGSRFVIPLPLPLGGAVVVGENSILYHRGKRSRSIHIDPMVPSCYNFVDEDGSRILIGDQLGRIHLLSIRKSASALPSLSFQFLGITSIPSTIEYLDNGHCFVGSLSGDSQLIQVTPEAEEDLTYIRIVENFTNVGPIVDFCVVDLEDQGQDEIITCSGVTKDGSLCVFRNGMALNQHACIDAEGLKSMWSLRENIDDEFCQYLVLSFVGETTILGFDGDMELGQVGFGGISKEVESVFVGNVGKDMWVQITSDEIRLISSKAPDTVLSSWKVPPGTSIGCADVTETQILVSIRGDGHANLIYFEIEEQECVEKNRCDIEHEIACLSIHPFNGTRSQWASVGLWTDMTVRMFHIPSLDQVLVERLDVDIIPRSILTIRMEKHDYLLCGMGDGTVFVFAFDEAQRSLSDRKQVVLGSQAVSLIPFLRGEEESVFVCSNRPAVIHSVHGRVTFSNVNSKSVASMASFHFSAYPGSLALATEDGLVVGGIDSIQNFHIRKIPLGCQPRRICHMKSSKSFLLAVEVSETGEVGSDELNCYLRLLDQRTFEMKHEVPLKENETVWSMCTCIFDEDPVEYFVIGTGFVIPDDDETTNGRILVFDPTHGQLHAVCETEASGVVTSMVSIKGKLGASVNNDICIYKWNQSGGDSRYLDVLARESGRVFSQTLSTRGESLLLGDLMKSITLYNFDGKSIQKRAEDCEAIWTSSSTILDDDTFLVADHFLNLYSYHKQTRAATEEDSRLLKCHGMYHLGDMVNKFSRGSIVMRTQDSIIGDTEGVIFGTLFGMIGMIFSLPEPLYDFLSKVEAAVCQVMKHFGGFSQKEFRAREIPHRRSETFGFIDGDVVEKLLFMSFEDQVKVAEKVEKGMDPATMIAKVEMMARLH